MKVLRECADCANEMLTVLTHLSLSPSQESLRKVFMGSLFSALDHC